MKKYKEGDRVIVYGGTCRTKFDTWPLSVDNSNLLAYRYGDKGTVEDSLGEWGINILLDKGGFVEVHPKQIRKLIKKKKK